MMDGEGKAPSGLDRARWLAQATDLLEGLLNAFEPHQLEAFHAYRVKREDVTVGDVAAARQLLLTIVGALDGSHPGSWPHIAMALDATLPEEAPVPSPLRGEAGLPNGIGATMHSASGVSSGPIDSTMPAMAPPVRDVTAAMVEVTDARPASEASTSSGSIDVTIAIGEMQALDLSGVEGVASGPNPGGGTTPMTDVPQAVLDIDKYAVLCAWTEVHPDRRDALHQQYGLEDEDDRKALDDHFEQLFRQDARMRAAFAQRLRMHLKFLRAGGE